MNGRLLSAAAAVALAVPAVAADYALDGSGNLDIGNGINLKVTAHAKNWAGASPVSLGFETPDPVTGTVRWGLKAGGRRYGRGQTTALKLADGRTYVSMTVRMEEDFPSEGLLCSMHFPAAAMTGGSVKDEKGVPRAFPAQQKELFVYTGRPRRLEFDLPKVSRRFAIDFTGWTNTALQDDRKWAQSFSLRIYLTGGGTLKAGETYETAFFLGGEPSTVKYAEPYVIRAGADWIPLDYRKTPLAGSAVDFSHLPFRDAPAGKHGWAQVRDGHFAFEKLPDVPQRFCGANFCGEGTCPTHADADRIVERFARAGYNSMRIHHYERTFVRGSSDRLTLNPEMIDRFDYFFAKAKERGIYTTTDIYVSRIVNWRDIGIDRDGAIDMSLVKGLFLVHEPAFENWKAFARNLLTHVNPYTGLRYADDPALAFISLVNEGVFAWSRGAFDEEPTRLAWRKWLAEERARDPASHPKAPADCRGLSFGDAKSPCHADIFKFVSDMESRFAARARDYLRSLGTKALLTDWNCGPYVRTDAITNTLDYVDMHFYVDHPSFLDKRWALPVRMGNSDPYRARTGPSVWSGKFARAAKMPHTISEWNYTAPNSFRGAGGLQTAACAAILDWDALWRFDYIGRGSDLDDGTTGLSYFSVSADPFQTATERAVPMIFMARALQPQPDDAKYTFPIDVEKGTGRFRIESDTTAGGFGRAGDALVAGPLACRLGLSHATVWASAVDAKPLRSSGRILLTHLTDLKTDGIRFQTANCQVLLGWGSKNLIVRRGTAETALALDDPAAYDVWALGTDGAREVKLPAKAVDGRLVFTADVKGADGRARFLYEIVRR